MEINNTESDAQKMADAIPDSNTEKNIFLFENEIANLNIGKPTTSVAMTQGIEKAATIPVNINDSPILEPATMSPTGKKAKTVHT